jgi:murein DD-endopeptidase MepM/ murein hydrolase activator NlpD
MKKLIQLLEISTSEFRTKIKNLVEVSDTSNSLLGGNSVKIPADGAHAGQSGWQSNNAWDIKASIGTPVYAVVGGTLKSYTDYGPTPIKKDGKTLFGAGFTVDSDGGLPDVYYTHLKDVTVRQGSKVECGQLLGYVMDFPGSDYDHLHIGVETGNIKQFLNDNGTLKCSDGKITPFTPGSVSSANTSTTDTSSTTTNSSSGDFDTVAQNIQNGILGSLTSAAVTRESVSLKEQRLIKNIEKIKKLL